MNGRVSKKIRQVCKRNWREFYGDILKQPFKVRLGNERDFAPPKRG